MDDYQIFAGFLDLLEKPEFDRIDRALQDLTQLHLTLKQYRKNQFEDIADAIVNWCAAHQPLGEQLKFVSERWNPLKPDPSMEELTIANITEFNEANVDKIKKTIEAKIAKQLPDKKPGLFDSHQPEN